MNLALQVDLSRGKEEAYQSLMPQLESLVSGETNLIANLANLAAVLKTNFGFWWVGFYLVEGEGLVLGPFQGPLACTRIPFGKGVCGRAALEKKSILVPNVDLFPGHIACSAASKSELVVPVIKNDETILVIDVDSHRLNDFDLVDQAFFESLAKLIAQL